MQFLNNSLVLHRSLHIIIIVVTSLWSLASYGQFNVERVLLMGRNALFYEDYVLSIQRFNVVIGAKPHLAEPYFFRGLAKFYLEDYTGAEADAGNAIYRNPYVENYYELRGLCRIHLNRFPEAEADYRKAVEINDMDANCWHNLVLCQMEQKAYQRADSCLSLMIAKWPLKAENYNMRAQVKLAELDTLAAEHWVDQALEVDSFDGNALSLKAMVLMSRKVYDEAERYLDKAIVQSPRHYPLFLNRALLRYNRDDLRGALSDYDAALSIHPGSFVGHFNRGLLLAQVGEDNRALEDFNYVLERQPDNYIALYNRVILLRNTGDYHAALRDLSKLLAEYTEFWEGYLLRAEIRRKLGDRYGAERDEFKVMKARIEGVPRPKKTKKTRSLDDQDLEHYDMLVEESSQVEKTDYVSELRGRVQDKEAQLQPMPIFLLTYFHQSSSLQRYTAYIQEVDELNRSNTFKYPLQLSNAEATVPEATLSVIFEDLAQLTRQEGAHGGSPLWLLRRAVGYYHVRDFESGLADVDTFLVQQPRHVVALMLRAQLRYSMLLAAHGELWHTLDGPSLASLDEKLMLRRILDDWREVLSVEPKFAFAQYNMGVVHMLLHEYDLASEAFTQALVLDPSMPDAYYNRGLSCVLMGQTEQGLADLSQAGELGLYSAYSLIKKFSSAKGKGK